MSTNILDYWPISSPPRRQQIEALEWLATQDSKYLIVEAPVGSGKSLIGVTYSRWLADGKGNSFILTPQRVLQEQYSSEFEGNELVNAFALYGNSNYACNKGNGMTCDTGAMIKPKCEHCPAREAKAKAVKSPNVIMNYTLALLNFAYTDIFKKRKLMILDECHNLESILTDFDAVTLTAFQTKEFDAKWQWKFDSIVEARNWVSEEVLPKLGTKVDSLQPEVTRIIENGKASHSDIKILREFLKWEELQIGLEAIVGLEPDLLERFYVLSNTKFQIQFKALYARGAFKKYIAPQADKHLFLSSTIISKEGFCHDLGIPPEEAAFISIDSEFPIENREVTYIPTSKMNYGWDSSERSRIADRNRMIDTIEQLTLMHENECGIIHTANFAVSEWLVDELTNRGIPHDIMHHNPNENLDRGVVINSFQNATRPTILISPSITEGLDLKYDLGRFAIFVKIPFPYLGDNWVKKRMNLSKEWYQRQAIIAIIQGGGRVVRAADDYGSTYILDTSWKYLYSQTICQIPKWWKEAYREID